jgi:hypothetical protein
MSPCHETMGTLGIPAASRLSPGESNGPSGYVKIAIENDHLLWI